MELAGCAAQTGAITAGGSQLQLRQVQTREYDTLDKWILTENIEQHNTKNRTVGGDQRQVDTQGSVKGGYVFLLNEFDTPNEIQKEILNFYEIEYKDGLQEIEGYWNYKNFNSLTKPSYCTILYINTWGWTWQ